MVATTQCLTLVLLFTLLSGNVFVRRTQSGPYSQPQLYRSKAVSLSRETNPSNQDVDTTREVGFTVYTFLLSLTHGLVAG